MTDKIKIGASVSVLDDTVKGIVITIDKNSIKILDEDGFERIYQAKELIVYDSEPSLSKGKLINKDAKINKPKAINKTPRVIDLHNKDKHQTSNNILQKQLDVFQFHLKNAINKKQNSITFIHGVGEGVLRKRIEEILLKKGLTFNDAPYYKYGYGAIEIYL